MFIKDTSLQSGYRIYISLFTVSLLNSVEKVINRDHQYVFRYFAKEKPVKMSHSTPVKQKLFVLKC